MSFDFFRRKLNFFERILSQFYKKNKINKTTPSFDFRKSKPLGFLLQLRQQRGAQRWAANHAQRAPQAGCENCSRPARMAAGKLRRHLFPRSQKESDLLRYLRNRGPATK